MCSVGLSGGTVLALGAMGEWPEDSSHEGMQLKTYTFFFFKNTSIVEF